MKTYERPAKEVIDRLFNVDAERGVVIWKSPTKYHPRMMAREAGSPRESRNGKRYVRIKINGVPHLRSHIIYTHSTGRVADMLDHINGNSLDDRICNLREATVTQNSWNHKSRRKPSGLPMGVSSCAKGGYRARITCDKKVVYLGVYGSAELASAAYQKARKERFGDYA